MEDISNTGPDPFRTGEQRLNIGLFYEGESTDAVVIDDVDTAFYIWSETFSIVSSNDPVEGDWSDEIIVGDFGWWGGGILAIKHWIFQIGPRCVCLSNLLLHSGERRSGNWTGRWRGFGLGFCR